MLFAICIVSRAETIWVARVAAGADDGTSAANAKSLTWLNTAGNWGDGENKVSAGDTVMLSGVFTNALTIAGSGLPASRVTIQFDTGASFTWGRWASTGAINLNSQSNLVIDGVAPGNGPHIQNTNNGTGLVNSNHSVGVLGIGWFVDIRNLRITNIYRKTIGVIDTARLGYPIDITGGSSVTVSNCWLSDADCGASFAAVSGSQSNFFLFDSKVLDCNHSAQLGMADSNCTMTNARFAGNDFDRWDTWDAPGDTSIHCDGIFIFNNSHDPSSKLNGVYIYNNRFGGFTATRNTSATVFQIYNGRYQLRNVFIWNNLYLCYPPGSWGNGFITVGYPSNAFVFNNTCVSTYSNSTYYGGPIYIGGEHAFAYNNLLINGSGINMRSSTSNTVAQSSSGPDTESVLTNYFSDTWSDYNIITGPIPGFQVLLNKAGEGTDQFLGGTLENLSNWQDWYDNNRGMTEPIWNLAHADPNSVTNVPSLDLEYIPTAGDTIARAAGTNLTTFLQAQEGFSPLMLLDRLGNQRPTSANWDIGAFQYVESGSLSSPGPGIPVRSSRRRF